MFEFILFKRLISSNSKAKSIIGTISKTPAVKIQLGKNIAEFHGIWLRDHCNCHECLHPTTKQRLLDTFSIPLDIKPKLLKVDAQSGVAQIAWEDNHLSEFSLDWLRDHSYSPSLKPPVGREINLWGSSLSQKLPTTDYKDIMNDDQGLKEWLLNIEKFGLAFVSNVPQSKEESSKLAKRISHLRETHYGSFWDFTSDFAHGDTAYSTLGLPAHTDTTYFTDPVGLQYFHLLEHRGTGGKSLYVDGFNAAIQLEKQHPWAFEALSNIQISAHASGDKDNMLEPTPKTFSMIRIDPETGHIYQIKANNDDRSPLQLSPKNTELFYASLHEWTKLIRDQQNELWIQLHPNQAVIMDNWRVLHGRSAFTGFRRMIGCYIGYDDFKSRLKTINKTF